MRVAIITGGTRGIGRGITDALVEAGEYQGFILSYNTNQKAAEDYCLELKRRVFGADYGLGDASGSGDETKLKIRLVGGDLSLESTRDKIFQCFDDEYVVKGEEGKGRDVELALVVHNAGQYVGLTSDNSHGINAPEQNKKFGDGSLLRSATDGNGDEIDRVDLSYMNYYHKLYGEAFIDLCERGLKRMRGAHANCQSAGRTYRGSIVGISSPGCNACYKMTAGYDMPGSGKCLMEFSIRHYALSAARYGINANVVIPGVTKSDAWEKVAQQKGISREDMFDKMSKTVIPMGEVAEARDIGDVVAFLSGNKGGRFMTGLSLRVDGGLHLGGGPPGAGRPRPTP